MGFVIFYAILVQIEQYSCESITVVQAKMIVIMSESDASEHIRQLYFLLITLH